jgi:hypothetical protein
LMRLDKLVQILQRSINQIDLMFGFTVALDTRRLRNRSFGRCRLDRFLGHFGRCGRMMLG